MILQKKRLVEGSDNNHYYDPNRKTRPNFFSSSACAGGCVVAFDIDTDFPGRIGKAGKVK